MKEWERWVAAFCYLSGLVVAAGSFEGWKVLILLAGVVIPILILIWKGEESTYVKRHAKEVLAYLLGYLLCVGVIHILFVPVSIITLGIGGFILIGALFVAEAGLILFSIIGAGRVILG